MTGTRRAACRALLAVAIFGVAAAPAAGVAHTAGMAYAAQAAGGAAEAGAGRAGACQTVQLPVALIPGGPASQTLSGTLCSPARWAAGPPVADVLTSGATYTQQYWDWPQDPALYSYVAKTLGAGRATFAYDRVGTGASSRPAGGSLTVPGDAWALHQVVQWLRAEGFTQIDSIGHSLGSVIAVAEAATYHDVDRLVVTGFLHVPNLGYLSLASFLYPARLDPQFAGQGLDDRYLTTIPGMRKVFYSGAADPSVIAYDEQHKSTVSAGEIATALSQVATQPPGNISDRITVPVLIVVGQQDRLMCGGPDPQCADPASVAAAERPYYASAPVFGVVTIPDTGHDIALHRSANVSFAAINGWLAGQLSGTMRG
jgi:pimeloyl-ACP methyl ester carboxylesterase